MNTIPCITDSDEFRYEADEPEDTDPRTDAEKRIDWICEEWKSALDDGSYEAWHDVRMMAYGAAQALGLKICRIEAIVDHELYSNIGSLAFENGIDCIREGNYEGA